MSIYSIKHHNCPTCTCTKPLESSDSAALAGYAPTESLLRQVKWWNSALHQMNKAIKRKNKYINRLVRENSELRSQLADMNVLYMEALNDTGA
jgi:hypothetical protein